MTNILQEEANFSRVGRIVLDLNCKVQREYLAVIVPPNTLPRNISNLKILNSSQRRIVQNITNIGSYDECDSSLLYILIRNLCNVVPENGWSKPVQANSINVADDIERLRVFRNELYGHATTAKLPNADFNQFIQDVNGIMTRFDSCHGGTYQASPSTGSYINELNKIITSPMDPVLQKHYKTHFIQLMSLQANITLHDTKIDAITQDLVMKDSQIKHVASNVASHKIEIKRLGNYLVNLDMKVDNVENNLANDLSTQFGNVLNDVVDHNVKIEDLTNHLVTQSVKINETETTLECYANKIDKLELDLIANFSTQCTNVKNIESNLKTLSSNLLSDLLLQKTNIEALAMDSLEQKDEQMKLKERLDVNEADIAVRKDEQIEIMKRVDVTEADIAVRRDDQTQIMKRVDITEADIAVQKEEQMKMKERVNVTEADIAVQKEEQIKMKERVNFTEADIAVQKDDQVKLKKRVDVNEMEIAAHKREITVIKNNMTFLNRNSSDKKNENSAGQCSILDKVITDDDSSHLFQMRDSNWYLSCHHDEIDQPESLINEFNREVYAPGDKKILKSYQCGYTKYDNEAGYEKYLIEKFDEQFGIDVKKQPWVLTNLHEDCVENRKFYELCKDVYSFCHNKKHSFLLIDVSIEDNLRNLGFDIIKVKEQLNVYDAEDPAYRILVYIGEYDIILNIRYVDSDEEKDISDAVRKGQNDTKLFCSLYLDILQKTHISFVSVVALNTKTTNDLVTCSKCISDSLIISNEKIHSTLQHIVNIKQEHKVKGPSLDSDEHIFVDLASRLWGTLSIRDIHLPHLRTDLDNALERIYLNRDQRQFLHSKKKHAILRGGYGSGKSLLAQEKFKYLIQNAKMTDDIFYLCFNDETLFKDFLKEQISENVNHPLRPEQIYIMNVDEYGKQFGLLPPIMFSEILNDINERCKKSASTPHIIADEYDSNNLTTNEAADIERNLQNMQDSYVLLISQSLESVRKRVKKKWFRKHEEKYEGQEFKRTGIPITMLDSIMRNTTRINDLSQATIHELEKHKSKIHISDTPVPIFSNKTDTKFEKSDGSEHNLNPNNESKEPAFTSSNDADMDMVMEPEVLTNEIEINEQERNDGENLCNKYTPATRDHPKNCNHREEANLSITLSTSEKENLVDKDSEILNRDELSILSTSNVTNERGVNQKSQNDLKSDLSIDYSANKPSSTRKEKTVDIAKMVQTYSDVNIIEKAANSNRLVESNEINSRRDQKNSSSKVQQFRAEENYSPVNFYHVLKKINPILEKSSSSAIESRFRFPGKGEHGHKVAGRIPALIDISKNNDINYDNINESDMKMRLLFALENIVNIHRIHKGMAVLVFEAIEAQIFHAIFLSMDISIIVYTPTIATGLTQTSMDDMVDKLKDHILVTDHVGARGLEFKHLLVTINPHEIYLYQHLVEALTRCIYDLSFIIFKTGVKTEGKFSNGHIIKVWEKRELVQKYEIEVCELHKEDGESMDLYCEKENNCYHIHTWHKDLKTGKSIENIKRVNETYEKVRVQYNRLLHHSYLEEDVRRKQDEQKFSKECTRRGYKTYKDIICGNEKDIVDMLFKVKGNSYITNFRDVGGNTLLEIALLHNCVNSLKSMNMNGLQFPIPEKNIC